MFKILYMYSILRFENTLKEKPLEKALYLLFLSNVFLGNIILSYGFTDITVIQTFYNSTFAMQTFPRPHPETTFKVYKHFDLTGNQIPVEMFILESL